MKEFIAEEELTEENQISKQESYNRRRRSSRLPAAKRSTFSSNVRRRSKRSHLLQQHNKEKEEETTKDLNFPASEVETTARRKNPFEVSVVDIRNLKNKRPQVIFLQKRRHLYLKKKRWVAVIQG